MRRAVYFIFENRDMAFYSRNLLLSLRNSWKSTYSGCNRPPFSSLVWQTLTSSRIRASRRGQRGRNYLRQKSGLTIRPIVNPRRTGSEIPNKTKTKRVGLPRCKNLWHFYFVFLARPGVWLLFNGLWSLLFSLFYVIREFDKLFVNQPRQN